MRSYQQKNRVSLNDLSGIEAELAALVGAPVVATRNASRHAPPKVRAQAPVQGHWDPIQGQQGQSQTVGVWTNGWRIAQNPKRVDHDCWEVKREINSRYTQYIQADFRTEEIRIFVNDSRTRRSVPDSFVRLSLGSPQVYKALAIRQPAQLQALLLKEFAGHFTVQ